MERNYLTSENVHELQGSRTRKESISQQIWWRQRVNTPGLSECCQAINKLSTSCQEENWFFDLTHFLESTNKNTNVNTKMQQKNDESFRVAVKRLSGSCQEAVGALSGKNHHNFEGKQKFGRWFRYHRRAYLTPSVLTPAKFDLRFRLSRGCSPSVWYVYGAQWCTMVCLSKNLLDRE